MLRSNFQPQRVFIVGDGSLFEEGLVNLLMREAGFSVSDTKYTNDQTFLQAVSQQQPDVILLNESTSLDLTHMLDLIFSTPDLVLLFVIVIRLENNAVDVYETPQPKRFIITGRDELVALVQGNFDSY